MSNGAHRHIDQDRWGLIPIIRAAYYLRWEVLEFLLERNELSRVEKIEARVRTDRRRQNLHLLALWPRVLYGKFSEAIAVIGANRFIFDRLSTLMDAVLS